MFQGKFEGLADHLWENHGLQLVKKDQIRTALNIDAANATFHLQSLIAGNYGYVVARAKTDHTVEDTIADSNCNCMDSARPQWMENFGPWITCSALFRNVKYKPEQAAFFTKFMPVLIQELAIAEPGTVDFNSKVSALTQVNKNLQYFLVENKYTISSMIELGRIGCQIGNQLCSDSLTELQGLYDLAIAELSKAFEKIGFHQVGNRRILKRDCNDESLWVISKPTPEDIMTMNAPRCSHGKALVNCRTTCKRSVTLPETEALTESIREGAYKNHNVVHNLFIGGDVMEDAMQEVKEKCSAKSASVEYLKQDVAEHMPDTLKAYVRDRNSMDLSSIVVTLMTS